MTERYPLAEMKDLPDDIRAAVLGVQEKAGFVPNVFLALARRPAEWRAFFAYHDSDCGKFSVVYRRRGYDYGVIRLVDE